MSESELELARRVHYAFLPERYRDESLDVTVASVPLLDLGGDYCGIEPLPEGRVAMTMCDATGHGIASALFASRINTYVLSRLARPVTPCSLIGRLNRFLSERMQGTGMYATFCIVIVDPRQGTWDFAGAGHPPAIHYRAATRDTVLVESQTTPVGIFDTLPVPCGTTTSSFAQGDLIVLHTDGLSDARIGDEEPFGLDRLRAAVVDHAELPAAAFHEALLSESMTYGGGCLTDDALILTAEWRGEGAGA